ncbi:MAG: heparinase II/III family protein [Planctomycetota bacterium]
MNRTSLLCAILLAPSLAAQTPTKGLLSTNWDAARLRSVLVEDWHPYPRAGDPRWNDLPAAVRAAEVEDAAKHLGVAWPSLPATLFLDYLRNGNRSRYQSACFDRRVRLGDEVLAEAIEAKGRFLDDIVDGVWLICEETYWGVPAHVGVQKAGDGLPDVTEPTVDLFAAETASLLAWTDYLLADRLDKVSPRVRPRIRHEIERRILVPCRTRDDFWWMGFGNRRVNNWNPWICSNWLTCVLLLDADPQQRATDTARVLTVLDHFTDGYAPDGGCDEGPGYWHRAAASHFDCLDLLHSASAGAIDVFADPLVGAMGRYIRRARLDGDWYLAFADTSPRPGIDAPLVFRYGRAIGDLGMVGLAAELARADGLCGTAVRGHFGHLGRSLPALFALNDLCAATPGTTLERDVWLPDLQVMVARESTTPAHGFVVAAKGGHNDESHNHNDVGNVIVLCDGAPVLVDAGVGEYTRKTFSRERYSIWTMRSSFHNLPSFGDVEQHAGRRYAARDVVHAADDAHAELGMDIAAAYPKEAGLTALQRRIVLDREAGEVLLTDHWQMSRDDAPAATWHLLTSRHVERTKDPSSLRLTCDGAAPVLLDISPASARIEIEPVNLDDAKLAHTWKEGLSRIVITVEHPEREGAWHALLRAQR